MSQRQVDTAHGAEESTSKVLPLCPATSSELDTTLPTVFVCIFFLPTKMMFSKSAKGGGRDPFAKVRDAKSFRKASYYKQDSAEDDSVLSWVYILHCTSYKNTLTVTCNLGCCSDHW